MTREILINGRYLTQPLSGVQRFATEMTKALEQHYKGRLTVLTPKGASAGHVRSRPVGTRSGQVWEQIELPRHVKGGVLINLGNMAPLRLRHQIVVVHDAGVFVTPDAYTRQFRLWYKFAQSQFIRRNATIVAVSEFGRQELSRWLGTAPQAISLVSEGADHMNNIVADRNVLDMLPPGRFVLAVGNLSAHKNLAALSALALVLAERGVTLVIAGAARGSPFQASGETTLPQPAYYLGRVSDASLKALYENAVCLVFPSRYEAFGLPAVEAMACGCPLSVSNIPALQETCADAACYFDPASPSEIMQQVCRILDDDVFRQTLRAAAFRRASAFTWDRAAGMMARVLDAMAPEVATVQ
jgi:glycosyltransferase involved in cell wall biosynthesis